MDRTSFAASRRGRPRRLSLSWILIFAAPALAPLPADAQQPVPRSGGVVLPPGAEPPPELLELLRQQAGANASQAAAPGAEDPAAAAAQAARMQALQQAVLDRRPSAILEAWASDEPLPVDEDPELALPEPPPEPAASALPSNPYAPEVSPDVDPAAADSAPPDAAEAAAAAAAQKAKAEYEAKKKQIEQKRLQRELQILKRHVTLGRFAELGDALGAFGDKGATAAYDLILQKLAQPPPPPPNQRRNPQLQQFAEQHMFTFDDVLGLIGAAPGGLAKDKAKLLAPIVARAFAAGHGFEEWMECLRAEVARPEDERRLDRRRAAVLLAEIGHEADCGEFLPPLPAAVESKDREALNLLARHYLALHAKKPKTVHLEHAWQATLAALSAGEIEAEEKAEALRRAVELAPKIRDELGGAWLDESFTTRPERGMEVLATIGAQASTGMVERAQDPEFRKKGLELLKTAVQALLTKAPDRAEAWRRSLNLLADVWLREARHSYNYSQAESMGPIAERDPYGNIYWVNYGRGYRSTPLRPIEPGELLELRPEGAWLALLDASVRPSFATTAAELYLKVNEEKLAFPFIEQLAATHPEKAGELAHEFLNVWIKNNDPNAERNRINVYNFAYGYNQRAAGIPLTRSKQERNLRDLSHWVGKLRALPGIDLDTGLLVRAFTASHSAAEVYRIETMESVFGSLQELDAKTLAQMAQTMRANLASVWRRPDVQAQAKTNRKQKDIEAEVQKGYAMAQHVLGQALSAHPDDWSLQVARAAMLHDLNNYQSELELSSEFSANRRQALDLFADAAESYVAGLGDLDPDEESTEAFEFWFQAALGASDIPAITEDTVLARDEIPKIKKLLDSIPGEVGERHRARFANALFTRLSAVNPAVKNRYLEAGFEIAGDHPQARAARKVYDYYRDLITEIELVAEVDGPTDVGTEPFGVHVELRYTREIERESGGFRKYLQNQANQVNWYYNYGRPPENYRDKFEEAARAALSEHFEVLSVTFNSEDASSKAAATYGWRRTPYAYLLLKAKGPQVDRVPPLKVDLDFLDVTGYVVLPVTSSVVPIDASAEPEPRPYEDLEVTQILDERKAKDGVLSLEIKAQATGLVPELEEILELDPADFEVDELQPGEVAVSRYTEDQEQVISERLWNVQMKARGGLEEQPRTFRFATPKDDATAVVYQRYDDADLMTATAEVELLGQYGDVGGVRWWWFVLAAGVIVVGLLTWQSQRRRSGPAETEGLGLPDEITPFSVLALLEQVAKDPGLGEAERQELGVAMGQIERFYFGKQQGNAPDLKRIAEQWLQA